MAKAKTQTLKLPEQGTGGTAKMATSLRIEPDKLLKLKTLALRRRTRVNDLILQAVDDFLAANKA